MNKKPKWYLQTDPKWSKKPYRVKEEDTTIGDSGCGPASAAMLIETLTRKTYTPEDACNWAMEHGYKALGNGTYYSYFTPQFAAFGIDCKQLSWNSAYHKPNSKAHSTALDLLKQGYYLIALMKKGLWTGSGHFVVVWWEDNKVRINDPASTKEARQNGDPWTFRNECAYYWAIDARKFNTEDKPKEEEQAMSAVYKHLQDVPECYRPSIKKLMTTPPESPALKGYKDPDPRALDDNVIDVTEDYCRVMTTLDRLGKL